MCNLRRYEYLSASIFSALITPRLDSTPYLSFVLVELSGVDVAIAIAESSDACVEAVVGLSSEDTEAQERKGVTLFNAKACSVVSWVAEV